MDLFITYIFIPFYFKVELKRHAFIFGSAVQAERMYDADPVNERYRDYFYDLFEWATLENALKWKPMEPQRVSRINTTPR